MSSVYLCCLVVGGGFAILSGFGELTGRLSPADGKHGTVHALRALVYSGTAFGAVGVLLGRLDPSLGAGMTLVFALLAGLLVGGLVSTLLAFFRRADAEKVNRTAGRDRP